MVSEYGGPDSKENGRPALVYGNAELYGLVG
jgi:hypothetical protein